MKNPNSKNYEGKYNHLKGEKSPYLIQHSKNPVDWYPWTDEAFNKAQIENKPIFLSIGYSTCHWCHVMAHESFEDPDIAELLNKFFVSIKVDREERPDIDSIYMTACQIMTGTGGWPLTIIMTPDKKPFFAGTYFPKESRFGNIGLKDLILNVQDIWVENRKDALNSGDQIFQALNEMSVSKKGTSLDSLILDKTYDELFKIFDNENGGFGDFQKFPTPHNLMFLLRYWKRTGNKHALDMVTKTLDSMANGGIYDHLGFGFHRYSVDKNWLVPHFEKMLYDQALISMAYTEVFQAIGKSEYKKVAEEVYKYVIRDMSDSVGGFYSAEDADSEGEEGKFYNWTLEEIYQELDSESADIFVEFYNIKENGNFNDGYSKQSNQNILHITKSLDELATKLGLEPSKLGQRIDESRLKLYKAREKRIHPHKDDKILTDWNGLMIASLALAGQVFNEVNYVESAIKAVDFIISKMYSDGRLMHRYRDGESSVDGNLDDYSFMIWGLLETYSATFKTEYLEMAQELNNTLMNHFWDETHGGFYFTADDGEKVLIREKKTYDSAIPSGNSVELLNMAKLAKLREDEKLESSANKLVIAFSEIVKRTLTSHTQFITGVEFILGPSYDVLIVGEDGDDDTNKMLDILRKRFLPNKVVVFKDTKHPESANRIAESIEHKNTLDGHATAYLCTGGSCKLPTTNPEEIIKLMKRG